MSSLSFGSWVLHTRGREQWGGARILYSRHWLGSCSPWAQLLLSIWDLSSPPRSGAHVPCIGRWILYQWTTRVVPPVKFLKYIECLLYCGSHWEGYKYALECCPFNHNRCSSSYTTHTDSPKGCKIQTVFTHRINCLLPSANSTCHKAH